MRLQLGDLQLGDLIELVDSCDATAARAQNVGGTTHLVFWPFIEQRWPLAPGNAAQTARNGR
jgi:hypothetical protein